MDNNETKAYVIGTLSIDADGIFHMSYVGPHKVGFRRYFGEGVESERNIQTLMKIVASRINRAKDLYVEKIQEIESKTDKVVEEVDNGASTEHTEPTGSDSP